ncbi:hypothetical protein CDL12_14742 [Handroanthus impetiginosus]|uniref:NB-ARC domain-containing protein n=1 Tax=Handroanthus impetiginosus TaxID=429701 RepID=A0A2G9H566_9LAMI|nr:hypothetical protein CDL12_14742 [Handroanthus impetiginosus]
MVQCLCGHCCSSESISEQCSYLKKPQALLQVLEDKLKLLIAREADVRINLRSEKIKQGMNPTAEVTLWLDNAQKIKAKLVSLEGEIEESESFLCGCFPNYYYRLKLGNKVSKKVREAGKLLDQSNFPGGSLVSMAPEKGKVLPTTTLVGETARRILQTTQEYLVDPNTEIIGIYGMGGVGKTTIVKEINNKLLSADTHFDDVIWVTASKDSDLEKLRKDICKSNRVEF